MRELGMDSGEASVSGPEFFASRFGAMIRSRRKEMGLTQDELALAAGVGRRFIIDLETGKPTCQLGRALAVASLVGFRPTDDAPGLRVASDDGPILPELNEDAE